MDFKYTIDPNADEPIMLIDSHIGDDDEEGPGIMADEFCRELMFLDTLNKSKINVWINSPGGSVVDGLQIYNTILKTKTKVDTHNIGMAASIALPIFLAGRKRYMSESATAMMHPVSGGDFKSREALNIAVNTMFTGRTSIPSDKITEMMNRTTWLTSEDCGPTGLNLCEIEPANGFNKPRKTPDSEGIKASWKEYKSVVNKLIDNKKPQIMSKVTNRLKLIDGTNEDGQVSAIDQIENRALTAESKLTTQETEYKAKIDALNYQIAIEREAKSKLDAKILEIENRNKEADKIANEAKAAEYVKSLADTGRIDGTKEEVIKDWTAQAVENFDRTKKIGDALPINKTKPVSNFVDKLGAPRQDPEGSTAPSIDINNTMQYVAVQMARVANNAKNRFK